MFKLQRLEITGFKSFADHTEIVFTGNGITAVVGPNGCGKSNVSDAISWVLGEQRARSLRGGEMKDVVFQGTKNRKPSGMAEVVLHLIRDENVFDAEDSILEDIDETLSEIDELSVDVDALDAPQKSEPAVETSGSEMLASLPETNGANGELVEVETVKAAQVGSAQVVERAVKVKRHWKPRTFALEFAPGEAVSVTRRLYLSGESEYLLNGKSCRLRDIQDLFAGTGLSGAHYAIIEQGRIGQILSAKPADRRNLIEEAAGISKFRMRQRAAESRLESAKTNLGRISDIVSEIEKQANSLRRQAAKTRRFTVLQEEFRALLRSLYAAEDRHFAVRIEQLNSLLTAAVDTEKKLAADVEGQEEAVRRATQDARIAEEQLSEVRRQHAENALERDRTEREYRYQSEQIVALDHRNKTLRSETEAADARLQVAKAEQARLEIEEKKETAEADESRTLLQEAESIYSSKIDDVRKVEKEIEDRRAEQMRHSAAVERSDEIARQLTLNLERLHERSSGLSNEAMRAEETLQLHRSELDTTKSDLSAERIKLEGLILERNELTAETEIARNSLRKAEENAQKINEELTRARNRLETLQEIEDKRSVYSPPIQKIFAERSSFDVSVYGVLADHLNVAERYERAVESVLGGYLQAVIVSSYNDARKLSNWIASANAGRVPILIVPGIEGNAVRGSSNEAPATVAEALGTSGPIAAALRSAFPRELSGNLVSKINGTFPENQSVLIDESGDILIGGHLLITGSSATQDSSGSLLAFKRELQDLAKKTAELDEKRRSAITITENEQAKLAEIEDRMVDLQSVVIKVERHILSLELQEKNISQDIERAERHLRVVTEESSQIKEEISDVEKRILESQENRSAAELRLRASQKSLDETLQRLADARQQAEFENLNLNEKRTRAATSSERRRSAQAALHRVITEIDELEKRIASLNDEIATNSDKINELRTSVAEIKEKIGGVNTAVVIEQAELEAAISAVAIARQTADMAAADLSELNRKAAEAMNQRSAIDVQKTEAVTEYRNLAENCEHELGLPLSELSADTELPDDFVLDEARIRVNELRERLDNFGAINMLAVEELAEAEERLLFLSSQRQDIIDSIASAEEALREIKDRSRERFRAAFEAINENFRTFFSELFGGGNGEMSLLEADDLLEAGIEVIAQPPGKRLQNIQLLSGGEKAMTAIALVLAIFKYRPSPFCLLDEVDAPLDDANVGRFVTKIADMSEKTQFIVITHNKRTMEAARALYGVTMQEAGVSKVVSVRFE